MGNETHSVSPTPAGIERRLAAILHADVQGYSRLIEQDEVTALRILIPYLHLMTELVRQYGGHPVGSRGDSLLAEFSSARSAVQCAVAMQQELTARNAGLPAERRIAFRMGIHVGEIVEEGEQLHGDGINIAVRIEGLAEPGGILVSGSVYDQVKNRLGLQYEDLGAQRLKNIAEPVRVYRVVLEESGSPKSKVQGPKSNVAGQQNRRVDMPLRLRVVFVLVSVLLWGGLATFWGLFHSLFPISHSEIRTPEAQPPALPLPDKPSIVVLPFVNMSNDPNQEYFSDGITEDLTTDLSKLSGLFVIARNSVFTYKGKAVKVQDVSKELGVRYVLEGSVRKMGGKVRVTAQLIDATTGYHLWTERYDQPLTDIFAVQDEVRQKIMTALKVKLTPDEQERFQRAPTDNLEAYDYYLRGLESFLRAQHETKKEANAQARQMYEKALELDPQYAGAYAGLGWSYWFDWFYQWNQDRAQSLELAFELTQRAITLDDSLSQAHALLGYVHLFRRQYEQAIAEAKQAVIVAPNNAQGYAVLGVSLAYAGRPEEGIGVIEKAVRLNPRYPVYLGNLGWAYRTAGRYEDALAPLKKALTLAPNFQSFRANLAACYAELGQLEEARAEMAEALRLNPAYSLEAPRQTLPYKDPADLERFLAALRKAGLK